MKILFVIALSVSVILLAGGYYVFMTACHRRKEQQWEDPSALENTQWAPLADKINEHLCYLADHNARDIYTSSADGLRLRARWLPAENAIGTIMLFHGYRSSAMTDFSGGAELSQAMGQNLLLVDQRAHGKSQGSTIAFGIRERFDCLQWCNYVVERFGENTQILLYGISMGAATVLMASGLSLPRQVKGIVADCPYASAKEIICKVGNDLHLPAKLAYPFVALGARLFGGFPLEETDAIRAVEQAKTPILIFHGEADSFVPEEMSRSVWEANPTLVRRYTFPEAAHGISYLADPGRYRSILESFAAEVLEKA